MKNIDLWLENKGSVTLVHVWSNAAVDYANSLIADGDTVVSGDVLCFPTRDYRDQLQNIIEAGLTIF